MINNINEIKDLIIYSLKEKKAEDINVIELDHGVVIAKYMIFASGRSRRNVLSIAKFVANELKSKAKISLRIEGLNNSEWVLIDTGDIIIHVFHPEAREYYNLEKRWKK